MRIGLTPRGWLYIAVAIIAVAPVWVVHYLPTCDGPCHLYNSFVFRELFLGHGGEIARWFHIDWRPHPNWSGHVILALLLTFVSPVIAEKLLFTAIVLLFLWGVWLYAGPPFAFLAPPFAYNLLMLTGFYNFSLGAALYFILVGVWWRRRDRPDRRTIAVIAVLLVLCYFSHPLPTALAIGSIGLLGIATRASWRHLLAFVPVLPLLTWFAHSRGGAGAESQRRPLLDLWITIARNEILITFDHYQAWLGVTLFVIVVIAIIATATTHARKWEERDAFLLLAIALAVIYTATPAAMFGGQILRERLALFVALVPLAWLAPRLPRRALDALAVALAILSIAYTGYLVRRFRAIDRHVVHFVHGASAIGGDTTLLPLLTGAVAPGTFLASFGHAVDYVAIERRAVDLSDYEAVTGYFPIAFNDDILRPDIYAIEARTSSIDIASYAPSATYIFTWNLEPDSPLQPQLAQYYRLVSDAGQARVWRRPFQQEEQSLQRILLPVAGSTSLRGAPGGVWWDVTQTMRNDAVKPQHVFVSGCAPPPCELYLQPGASVRLTANRSYLYVYANGGEAARLTFVTRAERIAPDGSRTSITIPAVRDREFRSGGVSVPNVLFASGVRLNLRSWTIGASAPYLIVRLTSPDGHALGERQYGIDGNGYSVSPDLRVDFPQVRGVATVILDAGTTRVWGFVSVIDSHIPMPSQRYPR